MGFVKPQYFREKTVAPEASSGTYTARGLEYGVPTTYVSTFTAYLGGRHIEYFVPGSGACFHTEASSSMTGFSGSFLTAPPDYHDGFPVDVDNYFGILPTSVGIGSPSDIPIDMARALRAMNPTKPTVSIPNFLHELKDVPGSLQKRGNDFLKENSRFAEGVHRFSSAYLQGKFGWGPMVSDLLKMMDFQKDVMKTFQAIQKIYKKGGLSRKYTFGETQTTEHVHDVNYELAHGDETIYHRVKIYASARWVTDNLSDSLTNDQLMTRANILTKGLYVSPRQVWDALPWSWFIDWFSNTGDFISANQNVMDIYPRDMWVHTKISAKRDVSITRYVMPSWWDGSPHGHLSGGNGSSSLSYYRRNVAPDATLAASSSYLNESQVQTAAALIGQRGFKI